MRQASRRSRLVVVAIAVAMVASLFAPGLSGVAHAAPIPQNLAPNGGSFSANQPLTWDHVPQATDYRVFVCTSSPCGSSNDIWTITTVNTTATPPNDLPMGTIHWTVESHDASGFSQPAAASFEKSQGGPLQQSPTDGATLQYPSQPPTFTWQAVPGARSYLLEIDDEPNFINPPHSIVTKNPTYTLDETQALDHTFYWRVRSSTSTNPKAGSAILSAWSATWEYSITWPMPLPQDLLVYPPDTTAPGTAITDIELVWNPIPGAEAYQLQVNLNEDFSGQMIVDTIVYSTRYAPNETWDNGSYHWRIRPRDEGGHFGDWSDTNGPFSFSRNWSSAPNLSAPPANETFLDPLRFSWSPIDHAAHYEVQIGDDENFSPGTFERCFTNHTLLNPYDMFQGSSGAPGGCSYNSFWDFNHGQTYFWRVRGIDADKDVLSFFSPVRSFIRREPIPVRTAPANGATVTTPVLTWNEIPSVQQYLVTIVDNNGSAVVSNVPTWSTTYTPHKELDPAKGPFRWYVRTRTDDGDGVIPNEASWSTFDVPDTPTTGPSPNLLTPANNSSSIQMPSMTWTPVADADKYEIWYSVVNSGVEFKLDTPTLENAGYTFTEAPLPSGTYDVHVRAIVDGNTVFGSERRISIIDPAPVTQTGPADCPPPGTACGVHSSVPELTWNHTPEARFYLVYLAFDPNFTNILKVYEVPQLSMIPREELPDNDAGQAYFWHVRPCKSRSPYRCGPDPQGIANPPRRAFQKRSAPVDVFEDIDGHQDHEYVGPDPNEVVPNQPRFAWYPYLGNPNPDIEAKEYRIQVSTVATFATTIDNQFVDQPFYTPDDRTYPEGQLFWRVRAIDGSGNELTWSPAVPFIKDSGAPTLAAPGDGQNINGQPTFSWEPQLFAESYQIEVYKNGDTSFSPANRVVNASTAYTQFTPSDPLPPQAPGVPYVWRVRRDDGQGKDGNWSPHRTFTVTSAAPSLTNPAQNADVTTDRFVFTWTQVPRAARYRIQTSNNNFLNLRENVTTVMTSWAPNQAYPPGQWSWKVQALDANDQVIGESNVRQFNRLNPQHAPQNVQVSQSPGRLTIRWDPPTQMPTPAYTGYRVRIMPGNIVRSASLTTRQVVVNGLVNGQVYDIKVMGMVNNTEGQPQPNVVTGTPNGCSQTTFSDVPAGHLFCNEIRWMFTTGLSTGTVSPDGTVRYLPSQPVARDAMAAFLYRYAGSPPVPNTAPHFADVPSNHLFFDEIQWMFKTGNSTGFPNPAGGKPLYKPSEAVDRQSMAAFLYRAAGSPVVQPNAPHFADVSQGHTFFGPIQWMHDSGLSLGVPNPNGKPFYQPTLSLAREAMAAFLMRYDQL